MRLLPKGQRVEIVGMFKNGATVPYLASLYRCTQEEVERALRIRLLEHELVDCVKRPAAVGGYKASKRDVDRLLKLVEG